MPAIFSENGRRIDPATLNSNFAMRTYILGGHSTKIGDDLMEVISLHIDIISRRNGRSAIQMAAYCARDKLYSDYTGKTYDYTDRQDLVYHEVMLPNSARGAFHNSEIL